MAKATAAKGLHEEKGERPSHCQHHGRKSATQQQGTASTTGRHGKQPGKALPAPRPEISHESGRGRFKGVVREGGTAEKSPKKAPGGGEGERRGAPLLHDKHAMPDWPGGFGRHTTFPMIWGRWTRPEPDTQTLHF